MGGPDRSIAEPSERCHGVFALLTHSACLENTHIPICLCKGPSILLEPPAGMPHIRPSTYCYVSCCKLTNGGMRVG